MKKLQIAILAVGLAGAMSASATIYSGSDFGSMSSYNGNYVSVSPGYEALSYNSIPNGDVDAVVGVRGPLGTLNSLSMSFQYSNPIGTGNAPFAAFGISDNGLWNGSGNEFLIISLGGNQLNGATQVHVWDEQTGAEYLPSLWGSTLNSILGVNGFGNMEVMRAYAYIGDTGGPSSGSVDINSITVSTVPEPTTMIAGALLLLPFGASTLRMLRKTRTA